ncbi:hypothetical protein AB0F91_11285 [Amycolatopsis sp. NPDC023774]|uniref:hypothetical protein n=1 Tax=Amycolatopsis sp. NPDC023774 TaxID=3155015 RepID=UPI0033F1074E
MITDPFAEVAGGLNLNLIATLRTTTAVAYPVLAKVFPEPREMFGPDTTAAAVVAVV